MSNTENIQGFPIWNRVEPDDKMFAFSNAGKWMIKGKQYKQEIVAKDGGSGYISSISISEAFQDAKWEDATSKLISKEPYYRRQEFITKVAEEIAENVYDSDETYGELQIISDKNGVDTISRVVINLDCGYQYIQIKNDSQWEYEEICTFTKFDDCILMSPESNGDKYSLEVPSYGQRAVIIRF